MELQRPPDWAASSGTRRPSGYHTRSLGLLVCLPFVMFTLLVCLSLLLFHIPGLTWVAAAVCLCITLLFIVVRPAKEGPKFWFNLGGLCLLAVLAGTSTGVWNFYNYIYKYWAYDGQRTYADLRASDPAASYLDAGQLSFHEDTYVDISHAVALASESKACVAPVVSKASHQGAVQFWAAGFDCCEKGRFHLEDAVQGRAKGGLVYLEDPLFLGSPIDEFRAAAGLAKEELGLASAEDALFIRWLQNPRQAQLSFWRHGVAFAGLCCIAYFVFSACAGLALHFGCQGPSRAKLEPRKA